MELSWTIKLRIVAVVALGAVLIGVLAWPLAKPIDPLTPVLAAKINILGKGILLLLAIAVGFITYFISWPYGVHIAPLAAPSGLAVFALRTGSVAELIQQNPSLAQRQAVFSTMRLEPFFWLIIVGAGYAGLLIACKIKPPSTRTDPAESLKLNSNKYLRPVIALVCSMLVSLICIRVFAQDTIAANGAVVSQPAIGQITFATIVSFGLAAFVTKVFFGLSHIWPTIATGLVTPFSTIVYLRHDVAERFAQNWPATFFPHAAISILPIQMVAFGTLGSITGYWLAVRYQYWRKHTIN